MIDLELKEAFITVLASIDLAHKAKDFEHLIFDKRNSSKILRFGEFMEAL
jgi:hypothetical protein